MLKRILGAGLALVLSTAASMAAVVPVFDGTFMYKSGPTACGILGASYTAVYRPQVGAAAAKTGLVVFLSRSVVGFTRVGNGQFNGVGPVGSVIHVGLTSGALITTKPGSFDITQSPAAVVAGTQSLTMEGTLTPTGTGCIHYFKAIFLRRLGT